MDTDQPRGHPHPLAPVDPAIYRARAILRDVLTSDLTATRTETATIRGAIKSLDWVIEIQSASE